MMRKYFLLDLTLYLYTWYYLATIYLSIYLFIYPYIENHLLYADKKSNRVVDLAGPGEISRPDFPFP